MRSVVVGGVHDGCRVEVEMGRSFVDFVVRKPHFCYMDEDLTSLTYTRERFIPQHFHANGQRFTVFGLEGMSPDEILSRLIEGYHGAQVADERAGRPSEMLAVLETTRVSPMEPMRGQEHAPGDLPSVRQGIEPARAAVDARPEVASEVRTIRGENMKKSCDIYAQADKEYVYQTGVNLGLTGEALSLFKYACSDVRLTVDVETDTGVATVTHVDGRKVS